MSKVRSNPNPARGEIWITDLDPIVEHEQGGVRPALIVSADPFNRSQASLVIVAPITTTDRGLILQIPVDPPEGGLKRRSFIMIDQVRTISKHRLSRPIGTALSATMAVVEDRLRFLLRL